MTVEILIRHAHEDEKLFTEFMYHLKPLERKGVISVFHGGKIQAGDLYTCNLQMQMQRAHIILPLISSHFMASDAYVETEQALLCPQKVSARIIPIILRPVDWQIGQLGNLKALPENHIPVKSWSDRDYAWMEIVQHIRTLAAQLSN